MKLKDYPKFYNKLKKYPFSKRKAMIDSKLEELGYRINRIPVLFKNRVKEKWTIKVVKESKILFDDSEQFFSFTKAVEYSRKIALEDFEIYS